jgi:type I restriction enzyme, S subunit
MSEWIETSVGDVVARCYSGPSPTCDERNIRSEEEWGLLKTTAVTWAGWNEFAHKVPPPSYWHNNAIEVHPGDVLITKAGPRHRVGVVVDVPSTQPRLMVSGKMIGLTPNSTRVLPRILAGVLATRGPQKYLDQRTTGMAESQVNFTNEALLGTPIRIPAMREQQRIAEILDGVDDAIRSSGRLIANLALMKQGLLYDLLTRGIDETGKLRDPATYPNEFVDTPHGVISKAWAIDPLGVLGHITSGTTPPRGHPRYWEGGSIPWVKTGEVRFNEIVSTEEQVTQAALKDTGLRLLPIGTILIAMYGEGVTRGRCAVLAVPATTNQACAAIEPDRSRVSSGFLFHCLQSRYENLRDLGQGSNQTNLNSALLRTLPICLPPLREQQVIVDVLDAADDRVRSEECRLQKLTALKRGLMDDLLTGRVRVTVSEDAA